LKNPHFATTLLEWYSIYKRDLPWRNTDDPYIIWLSEVILQQTRVSQGLPYFERFLKNYPTVQDLADASSDEVLRLWQGLGYYSRARNLHQCAKDVVEQYGGNFPSTYHELLKLKGVGSYTAAAIASFAFGQPVAVVDGNVFRILSRYFGISTDIGKPAGKKEFEALANSLIDHDRPGEFNQAIMEFGSLQCKPKNPDCGICPFREGCFAFNNNAVDQLPVKEGKIKTKERFFTYAYIRCGEFVVLKKRGSGDIWEGLHDFPLIEQEHDILEDPSDFYYVRELKSFDPRLTFDPELFYKHILSHQRIFANFVSLDIPESYYLQVENWVKEKGFYLVDDEKLENMGKPRLILRFLNGEK
jgi:A/G-specific adenine glycosylase